jgi:hypothetical protein
MRRRALLSVTVFCLLFAFGAAAAEPDPDTTAGVEGASTGSPPLADLLSPWFATAIGGLGSAAYLIAVWVGLVGRTDGRDRLLVHFRKLWGLKVPLYLAGGGGVAMVFQLPEAKLVPIQAFIIGCTWPAVVANYLSGRQSGEGEAQALETFQRQQDAARLESVVVAVPEARKPSATLGAELDQLMVEVSQAPSDTTATGGGTPPGPGDGGPTEPGKS